jgi:uncharacterized phiE125 gp8 family phage protein
MNSALKIVSVAASTAISLSEAKNHLKVENTADDDLITILIKAAQDEVESFTNRTLIATTFDFQLMKFPDCCIELPVAPVASITSIKYYNTENNEQTWSSENYFYSISEIPFKIRYVDSIPETYPDRFDAINVRFVSGYENAAAVPDALKQAILLLIGDMYDNRGDAPRERFTMWKMLTYPFKLF